MGTFYNGFTESYYVVLQEYPSMKTSCHSVYTPFPYSAITFIHSINVNTYTLHFRWFLYREITRFRFRREDSFVSKTVCTRQHWTQSDTRISWYDFVFHTYTFKIFFDHNVDDVHISLFSYKKSSLAYRSRAANPITRLKLNNSITGFPTQGKFSIPIH
jgi:hypothetical protein